MSVGVCFAEINKKDFSAYQNLPILVSWLAYFLHSSCSPTVLHLSVLLVFNYPLSWETTWWFASVRKQPGDSHRCTHCTFLATGIARFYHHQGLKPHQMR